MDFKAGIYNASGSGITGSTDLKIKIKRDADDYFYDFDDSTFKNAGWTTIAATMTGVDATNVPGEYEYTVDVSAWNDGVYTVYYQYSGSVITPFTDAGEFRIKDGAEAVALVSDIAQNAVDANALSSDAATEIATAVMAKIVDGSIDVAEAFKIVLAVLAGDMARAGNSYTYDDQTGSVKVTEVWTQDSVERTVS